jgi:hypothetical protein
MIQRKEECSLHILTTKIGVFLLEMFCHLTTKSWGTLGNFFKTFANSTHFADIVNKILQIFEKKTLKFALLIQFPIAVFL